MNAIFLPPLSPLFVFYTSPFFHEEVRGDRNQDTTDLSISFALAATPINEDDFLRAIHKTHNAEHDHNDQAIFNPKRKKWRIPKHRAIHYRFNFPKTKVSPQSQKEARIPGRRGREPRYNPKAHLRGDLPKSSAHTIL